MPAPTQTYLDVRPSSKVTNASLSRPIKKTRIVRRRGRAPGGIESDDELEREVRTDTESDDDSTLDTESESESASDDGHANGHSEVVTPSTTQSPPPLDIDRHTVLDVEVSKPPPDASVAGPFIGTTNWAEMVADEHANGAANLPVIDFADMESHRIDQSYPPPVRVRKPHKSGKRPPVARTNSAPPTAPTPTANTAPSETEEPAPPPVQEKTSEFIPEQPQQNEEQSHPPRRGQSARQAYQQRLEQDPSYVPVVGEFWGHDDRLMDKDLRPLSGWWRGRWESRGRGRGGFIRGRGGRGFFPGRSAYPVPNQGAEVAAEASQPEVPPIEQTWTHDGFEEMKKRDEHRRAPQQPEATNQAHLVARQSEPQRGFGFRGRGGFVGSRGRGGFVRGGAVSPNGRRSSISGMGGRPWFAMKPERMWTKQHDAFLYYDFAMKPRPGQGPGFRVKLPGAKEQVVRLPPISPPSTSTSTEPVVTRTVSTPDQAEKKTFTVRIPCRAGKERAVEPMASTSAAEQPVAEEAATTMAELSLEEVFTVRPHAVPNRRVNLEVTSKPFVPATKPYPTPPVFGTISPIQSAALLSQPVSPSSVSREVDPQPSILGQILPGTSSAANDDGPSAQIQETILRHPPSAQASTSEQASEQRPAQPILPPIQTAFSPIPQPSPTYGSPYGFAPALPPGIGMNQHGMPYELATGRAVYLQPTPPPSMFTPRQMMHPHMALPSAGVPFVPTHMHHPSGSSPDFLSQSHTPPIGTFIDPASGVPIFAPARQNSRIEIRAPTDATDGRKATRSSNLRNSTSGPIAYPAPMSAQQPMFFQGYVEVAGDGSAPAASESASSADQPQVQVMEAAPMAYPAYQQQYYYPEYAYPSYVDPSPQVMQYDMYPSDAQPQPMVYY